MGSIGIHEIVLLLLLLALVFGARKLPELGKGLGEGIRNFKKSVKDDVESSESKPDEKNSE